MIDSQDHKNVQVILKLLNINAAASLDPTYKGATIDVTDDPLLKDVKSLPTKDKTSFVNMAMEDFSKFACPPTFLISNVNTLMGFQIEGEAVFDKNGKALTIKGLSILGNASLRSHPQIALPDGATR